MSELAAEGEANVVEGGLLRFRLTVLTVLRILRQLMVTMFPMLTPASPPWTALTPLSPCSHAALCLQPSGQGFNIQNRDLATPRQPSIDEFKIEEDTRVRISLIKRLTGCL